MLDVGQDGIWGCGFWSERLGAISSSTKATVLYAASGLNSVEETLGGIFARNYWIVGSSNIN